MCVYVDQGVCGATTTTTTTKGWKIHAYRVVNVCVCDGKKKREKETDRHKQVSPEVQ